MKLKLYFLTLISFITVDLFWLGLVAPARYESQIGYMMTDNLNFLAAGIFYLIFVFGITFF